MLDDVSGFSRRLMDLGFAEGARIGRRSVPATRGLRRPRTDRVAARSGITVLVRPVVDEPQPVAVGL
jgi:hypothetical protein